MDACGVDEDRLAEAVASFFKLQVAVLDQAEPAAVKLLPGSVARSFGVFPLFEEDRHLAVATADPCDVQAEQQIGFASGRLPLLRIAPPSRIADYIENTYSPEKAVTNLLNRIDPEAKEPKVTVIEEEQEAPESLVIIQEEAGAGPIVRLTNMILQDAVAKGASDIHVQPLPSGGVVRLRIDGVLRSGITVPLQVLGRIISRIKIISRLDISDRMRPQDGRARILIAGRKYDLRVSTVPVRGGEKAVIRILDPYVSGELDDTGVPSREVMRLRRLLRNRDGILVVTGPTGSGKTTTMYAALREISSEDVNIMTVEDPVEYELPGLTQIQVDPKQGVTFQTALRAILRQDPDVIFVGEIRDGATAEMAAQASLTGHLVLATVHANDAVGSVRRFLDLGLDAATVSETLRGALAQRLLRTLCTDCAAPAEGDLPEEEELLAGTFGVRPAMKAVGCESCGFSGYRGRRPVVELIVPSDDILRMVAAEASHVDLVTQARSDGMRTMLEGALDLVSEGVTTLAEVERVLGEESAPPPQAADSAGAPGHAQPAPEDFDAFEEIPPAEAPSQAPTANGTPRDLIPRARPQAYGEAPTVLVVDDDADQRFLVRAILESHGWTVREAADGRSALMEIGRGQGLHLVILDLVLPDIDGFDVLTAVRASLDTANLPVVVLTGRQERETERKVLSAGADDYIRKPLDPSIFLTRAKAAVRRAHEI